MVRVVIIKNILDPYGSQSVCSMLHGYTIKQYSEILFPELYDNYDIAASIDGKLISDTSLILQDSQSLALIAIPQGGGSGGAGKTVLRVVAYIVVMFLSYYTGGAANVAYAGAYSGGVATAGSAAVGAMTSMVVSMAGSALINALLPISPSTPDTENSPTYGFDLRSNSIEEGAAIPVLYGSHRITPPRISMFIKQDESTQVQTIGLLFAVAGHPVDGIGDVEINDTKIDTLSAVSDVQQYSRFGENDNEVLAGFETTCTLITANCPSEVITLNKYVTYTTEGSDFTRLRIGFVLYNGLYIVNEDGNKEPHGVGILIEWRLSGSNSAWQNETRVFENKTTSILRYALDIGTQVTGKYEFRCTLSSAESESSTRKINQTCVEYYAEIVEDGLTYPSVSLLGIITTASGQISGSIPRVSCVATRNFIYVKDTTGAYLKKVATSPAWACYNILCDIQYVMNMHTRIYEYVENGPVAPERMLYNDFEDWANWCGYSCNIYLDTIQTTRKALDMVGILGRGVVTQQGANWGCIVDRPEVSGVQRFGFNMANIEENSFTEEWLSQDDRCNSIEVTYYDATDNWQQNTVTIKQIGFDESLTEVKPSSISYIGCTNKEMATSFGKYLLNCNRYLTLTCSFTAFVESIACYPGQIIELQHDVPQYGYGGKLLSNCTTSTLYLDIPVTMQSELGNGYCVIVYHAEDDLREFKTVSRVVGTSSVITLSEGLSRAPIAGSNFHFGEIGKVNKLMRVVKITRSSDTRRKITCLEFVNAVFEDNVPISVQNSSSIVNQISLPALESIGYILIWTFNDIDKNWYPSIRVTPVLNPTINYINLPYPISKIRVYIHTETGDTTSQDIIVEYYEYFFDVGLGMSEYSASSLIGKTVYVSATIIDTNGTEGPKCPISILYVNNQTSTPSTQLNTNIDLLVGNNGYYYDSSTYNIYINWAPSGWSLINNKYAPILTLNNGDNYYAYSNYIIVYGMVANLGDVPVFSELTNITTPNIGDIYDLNGDIITNVSLLDSICRNASSTHIDNLLYADTYYAIATIPVLKTGETCNLDFTQPDYGLDWVYAYAETPGTLGNTIEESQITDFNLILTMDQDSKFISEINWSYSLNSPEVDGFLIIYRSQNFLWSWELSAEVSSTQNSFYNMLNSVNQSSLGGIDSYNNFNDTVDIWDNESCSNYFYISISNETHYEIIKVDIYDSMTTIRGQENTILRTWPIGSVISYIPNENLDTVEYIPNAILRSYLLNSNNSIGSAMHCNLIAIKNITQNPGYKRSMYALLDTITNR